MKVGIDLRPLQENARSGVGQYGRNLLRSLIPMDPSIEYILFYNSFKLQVSALFSFFDFPNVQWRTFDFSNRLLNLGLLFFGFPKLDKLVGGADVWLSLNWVYTSVSGRAKHILVVHDLSFKVNPSFFTFRQNLWHFFVRPGKLFRDAQALIAVSNSTKEDLINLYGVNPIKIEVVYEGVRREIDPPEADGKWKMENGFEGKIQALKPYLLFLGTIEPRKNVETVVEAYNILRKKINVKLVIAGKLGWKHGNVLSAVSGSLYKDDIHLLGEVEEEEKDILYKNAEIFLFPSFYEGFGLPVLEAMSYGLPVITSPNSSLTEVGGSAVLYADPFNVLEIARLAEEVINDGELRNALKTASLSRSQEFSWESAAKKTLEIIKCA